MSKNQPPKNFAIGRLYPFPIFIQFLYNNLRYKYIYIIKNKFIIKKYEKYIKIIILRVIMLVYKNCKIVSCYYPVLIVFSI